MKKLEELLIETLSLSTETGDIVIASPEKLDKAEAEFFIALVRESITYLPQIIRGSDFTFIYALKQNLEAPAYRENFLKKCNEIKGDIKFFIT